MKILNKLILFIGCCSIISCSDTLDFNQLDDFVAKPVYTSSLAFFTLIPGQFFDNSGIQQNSRTDISDFKLFENSFIKNNAVKFVFNAEIKNEFDRDVTINVELLDEGNRELYTFTPIFIQKNDENFVYEEEIDVLLNPDIINTIKVRIKAELENTGIPMNPNSAAEFEFKSAVSIHIESDL